LVIKNDTPSKMYSPVKWTDMLFTDSTVQILDGKSS
jgi:hypothetical protein